MSDFSRGYSRSSLRGLGALVPIRVPGNKLPGYLQMFLQDFKTSPKWEKIYEVKNADNHIEHT